MFNNIAFFADMHYNNWPQFSTILENGINSRLQNQTNVTDQIREYCIKHKIKTVFHLGDIFHSKRSISVDTLHFVTEKLAQFKEDGIDLYHLNGNHDYYSDSGQIYSSNIFKNIAYIIAGMQRIKIGNVVFHCIPYMSSTEKLQQSIKDIDIRTKYKNVLLLHAGLQEAKVGPYDTVINDGFSAKELKKFDYVLLGHYHKYQKITDRIIYVGSPLMHNFGERNDKKGFVVADFENDEIKFVQTEAPRFLEFHVKSEKEIDLIKRQYPHDFVKIIADNKINIRSLDLEGNVFIENKFVATDTENRLDIGTSDDTDEIISKFIESVDIDFLNKKTLMKTGRKVIDG